MVDLLEILRDGVCVERFSPHLRRILRGSCTIRRPLLPFRLKTLRFAHSLLIFWRYHCSVDGIWGFLRLGREAGVISPPHLVLPITIEPSKPCLHHEERFLNLWSRDLPFKLDHLVNLPGMFCLSISRLLFKTRVDISMFGYIRHRRRTLDSRGIISFLGFICSPSVGRQAPLFTTAKLQSNN